MSVFAYRVGRGRLCLRSRSALAGRAGAKRRGVLQGPADQLIVGYEVGNDYDIGARLLARYLSKELPGNPTIVVQNMPQASGVVAANYMAVKAARDGTVIGGISRNLPSQAMMKLPNIEADPRKFIWLGATSFPGRVCVASSDCAGEDRGRPVQAPIC